MAPRDAILLMQRCWHHDPAKRPQFEEIHGLLLATETALGLEEAAIESGQMLGDKQLEKGPPLRETGHLNNSHLNESIADGLNVRATSTVLCTNPMLMRGEEADEQVQMGSQPAGGWISATHHDLPLGDDGRDEHII